MRKNKTTNWTADGRLETLGEATHFSSNVPNSDVPNGPFCQFLATKMAEIYLFNKNITCKIKLEMEADYDEVEVIIVSTQFVYSCLRGMIITLYLYSLLDASTKFNSVTF